MPPRTPTPTFSPFTRLLSRCQPYRCFSCSLRLSQSSPQPQPQPQDASTTHFGFQSIPSSTKTSRVSSVFSSVASSYDNMNDIMSLGIHRLWKDHFVRSLNPGSPSPSSSSPINHPRTPWTMLDVAGGTGDIAFRLLDHASLINGDNESKVIVSDINPDMLAEGKRRASETPYADSPRLEWLEANAESLPASIPPGSIDLYTVAFGIRNFTHKDVALREAYRVLKPGGVFACLEFSHVDNRLFNSLYKRWSFGAIPIFGQLVAGDRDSYQYLVESIERFPRQKEWRDMIRDAGFMIPGIGGEEGEGGWEDLMGGIAAVHKGVKPLG
ncbi:MAG: hypothetical protein LQ344_007317 [Seirophora lacunosa]|nr:MAG: hypothetical protein LQ344_007317 [Seirophora lacunosa]